MQMTRLIKLLVSALVFLFDWLATAWSFAWGRKRRAACSVLYYHSIPANQVQLFSRQMDLLNNWAIPVHADYAEALEPGYRYAVVTFDDGLVTVSQNALPELARRGIPCTVFVVSELLGKRPTWAADYFSEGHADRVVTAEELSATRSPLVLVGSHTLTHTRLTSLTQAEALRELAESRRQLERHLGTEVGLFSFPYGAFDSGLIDLCRQAGYRRVFTTLPFRAFMSVGEYVTGRVPVDPLDSKWEFILKLCGAYRWLPHAFRLKRTALRLIGRQRTDRARSVAAGVTQPEQAPTNLEMF